MLKYGMLIILILPNFILSTEPLRYDPAVDGIYGSFAIAGPGLNIEESAEIIGYPKITVNRVNNAYIIKSGV
jgi:hypothetical protein